jgi:hypothetical protein
MTQGASPGYSGWTSNADGTGLRITRPGRIDFHNCTLTVTDASIGTYVRGAVPTVSGTADYTWPVAGGGRIVFDTCTFNGTRTGSDGLLTAYVNRINSTAQNENNNKLVFTNCTFGSGLDYAFMTGHAGTYTGTSGTGGMYVFTNPTVNAAKFLWLNGHNGGPTYSNFNIEITGGTYTNMGEWGYQYGYTAAANGSDNILKVSGVVISEAQNVIGNFTGIGATQFSRPDAAAGIMREIYGCTESPITSRIAGYVWAGATYDTLSSGWTVAKETWETAVSLTLSSEFDVAITAGKYFNGRYEVPTSALTGDKIRLTYPAHSTRTATVAGCSFGARSGSTMDFSTTPTRITFDGGNNGYTKTAGSADKVSDAITFAYNGATAYLHHLTHGTGGYYAQKYATLSGNDLYYLNNADNDEVLTADVTGYNAGSNEIGDFSKLEVRTSINSYKVSLADEPDSVTYNGVTLTKEPGVTLDVALNKWDWSSADGGTLWVNVGEDPTTHDLIAVYGTGTAARDVAYFDGIAYKCTAAGIAGVATWSLEEEYPPQVTGYFDDVWYDSGWYH